MAVGIVFIVLGLLVTGLALFTNGIVNNRRYRWMVNLIGPTATKIVFAVFGIAFAVMGALAAFGVIEL